MLKSVKNQGRPILDLPFRPAEGVQTYLDGANRDGIVPYRAVIIDASYTPSTGKELAPVKYPNTSHTNGEKVIGVVMGPVITNARGKYEYESAEYPSRRDDEPLQVRTDGIAVLRCDSSVVGTPIVQGDFVAASTTANFAGCAKKGALTNNAPSAGQHIIGIALESADKEGQAIRVLLRFQEV